MSNLGKSQPADDAAWSQKHQSDFAIKHGTLHKAYIKGKAQHAKPQWQVVVPHHLQSQVIQAYRSSKRNAHYGDLKTFAQLRENFTWNSAFSDVRKFAIQCGICQQSGPRLSKSQRQWSLKSKTPGAHWVMDVVHMPKARSEHEWLLTMVDVMCYATGSRPYRVTLYE